MGLFNYFRDKKERTGDRYILCLDGGGMRGIIPVVILKKLEECIRAEGAEKTFSSYFDFIAGTSTGGLIALSLTCPSGLKHVEFSNGSQIDLSELENTYMTIGKEVFPPSSSDFFGIGKAVRQIAFDKYSYAGIENLLKGWFEDVPLTKAEVPTLIMAYDIGCGKEAMLRSYSDDGILAWEAGRATTAAPTYFAPFEKDDKLLADGGVIANNPSLYAYVEAKKMYPECKCFHILSIGTAGDVHTTSRDETSGLLSWIDQVYPMYTTAQRRTVDYIMEDSGLADYLRINTPMDTSIKMDDIRDESMKKLYSFGVELSEKYDEQLRLFAKHLVKNKS